MLPWPGRIEHEHEEIEYPGPYADPEYTLLWEDSTELGRHIYRWSVSIRQAQASWMIAGYQGGFRTKWGARRWAKVWLKDHAMEEVS